MLEKDLVKLINNYLEKKHVSFDNEINIGIGIPDIYILSREDENYSKVTNYSLLEVYSIIKKYQIKKIKTLQNYFNVERKILNKILLDLSKCGIIEIKKERIVVLEKIDFSKLQSTLAIEVKLKDWRSGLLQAERYLRFSDYSTLIINDSNLIQKIDRSLFEEKGIGLIVNRDNRLVELIKPKKSKKCDRLLKYIAISKVESKKYSQKVVNLLSIWKES